MSEDDLLEDERMAFRAEVLNEIRLAEVTDADERYDQFQGLKTNF